jgi:hypothetical protein
MSMLRRQSKAPSSSSSVSSQQDYDIEIQNKMITSPPRSESMAYSVSPANDAWSKIMYHVRYNTRVFVGGVGMIMVVLILILDGMDGGSSVGHGGLRL